MTQFTKSFGKLPASAINGGGVRSQISWDSMMPYLKQIFHIKPHEVIEGIEVSTMGIKAHITTTKKNIYDEI